MVEDVLAHQQEHLSLVESVMGSTADLVDAVIATARQHVREEREAGNKSRQLAVDTANDEVSRDTLVHRATKLTVDVTTTRAKRFAREDARRRKEQDEAIAF